MAQGAFFTAKRGRRGKRTMRFGAALLTAAIWMLFMLTSCAEGEPRPTVQKDDLSPQPDAQERLELAAGNGKNYACHWDAQDIEAALAQLQAEEEQHIEARLAELEQLTPAQLAERGWGSVDQARKFLQEEAARTLAFARLYLQEEAAREPVFTAQEAANRAGALFEELYGADFSNEVLEMHCEEREGYRFARPEPLRTVQLVWEARPLINHLDQSRDWSAFNDFSCTLDADTGEILSIWHHRSEREYEEWMCGPLPECWREDPKTGIRRWDTGNPAFETLVERAGARLSKALSGTFALNGAQVTEISWSCTGVHLEADWDMDTQRLTFYAKTDDGRRYQISGTEGCHPIYREEEPQIPLRGILITNITDAYLE